MALPFPTGSLPYDEVFAPNSGKDWAPRLSTAVREARKGRRKSPTLAIIGWGFRIALLATIVNLLIWLSYQEWQYLNLPH